MYTRCSPLWFMWKFHFPDVSQLTLTVTLRTTMENTTRPALNASCLKTPPSSLMASQRDGTFSSSVRLFSFFLVKMQFQDGLLFFLTPSFHNFPKHVPACWNHQSLRPSRNRQSALNSPRSTTLWAQVRHHFSSPSTQFRVPSCAIYIVNRALFCQICVQMTGKLPHLLQTRQRMINLMFSRLRTKDHSQNVLTAKHIQLNLRWTVLSSLCTNIKLYFMKTLPAVLSVFG